MQYAVIRTRWLALLSLLLWTTAFDTAVCAAETPEEKFFLKKVRPLLVDKCFECHSAKSKELRGNLRLDSRDAILEGGDRGPAAEPGDPDSSLLMGVITYEEEDAEMPPDGKLSDEQIEIIRKWIEDDLVYPNTKKKEKEKKKNK